LLTFSFAGVLANFLSAAQNETEIADAFDQHQINNTQQKTIVNRAFCAFSISCFHGWHYRC
jgi:hypothetical protein